MIAQFPKATVQEEHYAGRQGPVARVVTRKIARHHGIGTPVQLGGTGPEIPDARWVSR